MESTTRTIDLITNNKILRLVPVFCLFVLFAACPAEPVIRHAANTELNMACEKKDTCPEKKWIGRNKEGCDCYTCDPDKPEERNVCFFEE